MDRTPRCRRMRAARAVVALVGLVAEGQVGVDGVEALILQVVGPQFIAQADAAAFLRQIEQHAVAFGGDQVERQAQLLSAIAA